MAHSTRPATTRGKGKRRRKPDGPLGVMDRAALVSRARLDLAVELQKIHGGDTVAGASAKAALWGLFDFSDADGKCFPGVETARRRACMSAATFKRSTAFLASIGVVRIRRRNTKKKAADEPRSNLYRIDFEIVGDLAELTEEDVEHVRESMAQSEPCPEILAELNLSPEHGSNCAESMAQSEPLTNQTTGPEEEDKRGGPEKSLAGGTIQEAIEPAELQTRKLRAFEKLRKWISITGEGVKRHDLRGLLSQAEDGEGDPLPRISEVLQVATTTRAGAGFVHDAISKDWTFSRSQLEATQ